MKKQPVTINTYRSSVALSYPSAWVMGLGAILLVTSLFIATIRPKAIDLTTGYLALPKDSLPTTGNNLIANHNTAIAANLTPITSTAITAELLPIAPATSVTDLPPGLSFVAGTVQRSFFVAARLAGLSAAQIAEVSRIFHNQINFAKDIRSGDNFKVLYQDQATTNSKTTKGNIVAAELTVRGKIYQAIGFQDPKTGKLNFYTPQGNSLEPGFLRYPVNFSHISSHFSLHRYNPVLHIFRPHKGVDYAAPTGTPIKAASDGKIISLGTKGGYGKAVAILHQNGYSTLYAHMVRYAKDLKVGSHVSMGQVIGYVGATGLATGAHLHYEVHLNGIPHDPLTIALPSAAPLPKQYRVAFLAKAHRLLAAMELHSHTRLAENRVTVNARERL